MAQIGPAEIKNMRAGLLAEFGIAGGAVVLNPRI
jgi:hypothetical protein